MKNNNYKKAKETAQAFVSLLNNKEEQKLDILDDYIKNNPFSERLTEKLSDISSIEEQINLHKSIDSQAALYRLDKKYNERRRKQMARRVKLLVSSIAAVIIVISFAIYNTNVNKEKNYLSIKSHSLNNTITKPQLTLSDGTMVDLSVVSEIKDDNITIAHKGENIIEYKKIDMDSAEVESYNTIVVPMGYTFDVELSDGTMVKLNANSKLRYPVKFIGDNRRVYLEGEAFFNVSKSNKRFVVELSELCVKAYGTSFNINTYDKNSLTTILVSGSIGVYSKMNQQDEVMLTPNQIHKYDKRDKSVNISQIDASYNLAWINNKFSSNNETLSTLLTNISKWYGVDFKCANEEIFNTKVTVVFNRDSGLNNILKSLEAILDFQFIKEDRDNYVIE